MKLLDQDFAFVLSETAAAVKISQPQENRVAGRDVPGAVGG